MNQSSCLDDLLKSGWRHYRALPRWRVLCRKTQDPHYQFNPEGLEFIILFKNGRTAKGFINP